MQTYTEQDLKDVLATLTDTQKKLYGSISQALMIAYPSNSEFDDIIVVLDVLSRTMKMTQHLV